MNRRYVSFVLIALTLLLVLSFSASAHSGGTDSNGGHYDHDTWEYHYHHGYSAHDHYDMDGDGDNDCPFTFTATTASSDVSAISSTSSLGYHFTYDELIEYKLSHYNDGYENGYEKGKTEGYSLATEDLTQSFKEDLHEEQSKHRLIIGAICAIFVFIVAPLIVSIVERTSDSKIEKYIVENNKLKANLANHSESLYLLDSISSRTGMTAEQLVESFFVGFRKAQGISIEQAKAELSEEKKRWKTITKK